MVIESTRQTIYYQNVPYIFFFIMLQLFIRDKPETPPSAVAAAPANLQSFQDSFKEMWANKNFMTLSVAYALIYGVGNAISSTMSNLLNPFGYIPSDIAVACSIALIIGVVGALCIGSFLDHTAMYRKTHVTLSFVTLLSIIVLVLTLKFCDPIFFNLLFSTVLFGIGSVSFYPTSLSYGAELTFPLQPALVNACMNFLGQLSSAVFIGTSIYITDFDAASTY